MFRYAFNISRFASIRSSSGWSLEGHAMRTGAEWIVVVVDPVLEHSHYPVSGLVI